MKDVERLFKQSIKNRRDFLEKKKNEWIDCNSERQKKDLIVKLIQLEPSHLAEDWILDQVIKWLKDRKNNLQYLEAAFMKKGKRNEMQNNMAETFFLFNRIERVEKRENCSRRKAIEIYLLTEDEEQFLSDTVKTILKEASSGVNVAPSEKIQWAYGDLEKVTNALEQRLKRFRKYLDKRTLPFPYYGLDVVEFDKGNEKERLEVYIDQKPLKSLDGKIALFGSLKMSFPLIKKTTQ